MAEVEQQSFGEQDVDSVPQNSEVLENLEVPEQDEPQPEQKQEHYDEPAVGGGAAERKWPGWPGESVFRMLVPAQKVGSIIGRKGEFIKKIVEETRARIKILDGPPGTAERAVSFGFYLFKWASKTPLITTNDLLLLRLPFYRFFFFFLFVCL